MTLLHARAIPVLEAPYRGIHLMWTGPAPFLFAPGGWVVERRPANASVFGRPDCVNVMGADLAALRTALEVRLSIGWLRVQEAPWEGPEPGPGECFTLDLDQPSIGVTGSYRGRHGLAIGLYRGKATAFQFLPLATDGRSFDFGGAPVDQVLIYGLKAAAVQVCRPRVGVWQGGTVIAKLQLPLREFMPGLGNDAGEWAEAKSRLAPGESIDEGRFREVADILRVALRGPGRRPIDNLLRMKSASENPEEMFALDPLRTLLLSPKWRRVLGLGFIDRDAALVEGASYDYRIVGRFPAGDVDCEVCGFHTIPPGTALPAEFSLGRCRLRFPQPVTVETAPGIAPSGAQWTTRSGIALAPRNSLPWVSLGIEDFSVSLEFPAGVSSLELELEPGHSLRYAAGGPGLMITQEGAVPAGTNVRLSFAAPITHVHLAGKGFLFAVRLPGTAADGFTDLAALLPAVKFVETPRPAAPLEVTASNLQRTASFTTSAGAIPPMHLLGFDVKWLPSPAVGSLFWPSTLPVPSPLDAAMFQVERRIEPNGPYDPVLDGEDNAMFGSRDEPAPDRTIAPGMDLLAIYPEDPPPVRGSDRFRYQDVFRAPDEEDPARRKPPAPGTLLRYRVRTVDAIGRPSVDWKESDPVRLEKHVAPPPPDAYSNEAADAMAAPGPTGVAAKVLVKGDAELTPRELELLGDSDNAIVLGWGWRQLQRTQDPFATQFRVYVSPTFDVLPGVVTSVNPVAGNPGDWQLTVQATGTLRANAAAGLALNAGYPFLIVEHGDGPSAQMLVRTRIPDANGDFRRPQLGPVQIPLKLSPALTQPRNWAERVMVLPITAEEQYEAVLRDRLLLSAEHPRDSLWVGVTACDSEAYVSDAFPHPGPLGPLPGNESAVVAALCEGRRAFLPELQVPAPAGDVPRVIAPEPVGANVRFSLDLTAFVSALNSGTLCQPERCSVSALFETLSVEGGHLRPVSLPNPADEAAAVAAVQQGVSAALEDRLAVAIAARHPQANQLFRYATPAAITLGPFEETLPSSPDRYLYRVRRADGVQRLSAGAALANVVVKTPSTTPGAAPRLAPRQDSDPAGRIRLRVPADRRVTHLLYFEYSVVGGEAELLRVPNRPELLAGQAIRLQLPDGVLVVPSVRELGPPTDGEGWVEAIDLLGGSGPRLLWAATLTEDGAVSQLGGPWRVTIPRPPLETPVLSFALQFAAISFAWTLPDPLFTSSWLEVSSDGVAWDPASAVRRSPAAEATVPRATAARRFRAVAVTQDGRQAVSEVVTV